LKVTILGSGGAAVSAKRACPSILVDDSTLFDLGPGSLRNLKGAHLDSEKLSRVFISHTHADHISDLVPFLWAIQIDGREKPLTVYGPPGFKETLRRLLRCMSTSNDFFKFPVKVSELKFGERKGDVRTCRASHTIPTMAYRVEANGRSLCYTADTTYCPAVVELARNVDLLIHEATFLEDQLSTAMLTRHSTPRMAGRAARESNTKRLALFHIPPPNDRREKEFYSDAKLEFRGEVTVAEDMAVFEV
jgi:ribonuclease BN (tRNA processing enzyme)